MRARALAKLPARVCHQHWDEIMVANSMFVLRTLAAATSLAVLACSSDGDGDSVADVADAATDVVDVVEDTAPPPPPAVEFVLRNGNPGGQSRWVQVESNVGAPGWWTIVEDGVAGQELRPHDTCTTCNCGAVCNECEPTPMVQELAVGEQIEGEWDLALYTLESQAGGTCEQLVDAATPERLRVQFCWSPNPPAADGRLPQETLSCTRLVFSPLGDPVVRYDIEALSSCGDGRCDPGETTLSCPGDCDSVTATDVVIACIPVCTKLVSCSDEVARDQCEAGFCGPLGADLRSASEACLLAQAARYECAAGLSCADLAPWLDGADNACLSEDLAAQTACADE